MSVRIGFVGCGEAGLRLAKEALHFAPEEVEITGIYDTLPGGENERAFRAIVPDVPPVHENLDDVLARDDVDAVIAATYHSSHVEIARKALAAGKHVMVEKPLATQEQWDEVKLLAERARDSDKVFMALPFEGYADLRAGLEFAHEDVIGPITAVETQFNVRGPHKQWYYDREIAHGGAILDTAVYGISRLCTIMGPVRRVSAVTQTLAASRECVDGPRDTSGLDALEDDAVLVLEFGGADERRALGLVRANWGSSYRCDFQKICGLEGTVLLNARGKRETAVHSRREPGDLPVLQRALMEGRAREAELPGPRPWYEVKPPEVPDGSTQRMRRFLDLIAGDKQVAPQAIDLSLHVVEVMCKAYASAEHDSSFETLETTFEPVWRADLMREAPFLVDTRPDLESE